MIKILLKQGIIGILGGVCITILFTCLAYFTDNPRLINILLPPMVLVSYLMPSAIMGYDAQGRAMREGTPIDLFLMLFGFFLCVVFYSIITIIVFNGLKHTRKK